MNGDYVFRVRLRVEPTDADLRLDDPQFETLCRKDAPEPGSDGWLFFRDMLWRGEVNAPEQLESRLSDGLGVTVEHVEFRELTCNRDYYDALYDAVAADLDAFRADDADSAVRNYFGNRIRVTEDA